MTKRKLTPYDGIHTCSKGCSKPGCTRTLRDTIEEQDTQIEALKRDVLEKTVELRNLKEVVADLHNQADDDLGSIETERTENARLKAEVERLRAFTSRTIVPNEELQSIIKNLVESGDEMKKVIDEYRTSPYGGKVKNAFYITNNWQKSKSKAIL